MPRVCKPTVRSRSCIAAVTSTGENRVVGIGVPTSVTPGNLPYKLDSSAVTTTSFCHGTPSIGIMEVDSSEIPGHENGFVRLLVWLG